MERTGLTPSGAYNTDEGRVFVVDPEPRCRLFFVTNRRGNGSQADHWIITRTYYRGDCLLS